METMKASTHYGDFKGSISIDFYNGLTDLDKFCQENNINIENRTPVGIHFHCVEKQPYQDYPIKVSIYIIEDKVWDGNYKTVGEYLEKSEEYFVKEIDTDITFDDFFNKALKRFDARLYWSNLENKKKKRNWR
jgi:hypothetical protein